MAGEMQSILSSFCDYCIMFLGEYSYNIDDKKRLALPVRFRSSLGKNAFITKGLDGCLWVFPAKDWEVFAKKISEMPLTQADARGFSRNMLAGAMEVSLDRLGRILIPDYLKESAGLSKKVVVAGLYNRIEIWDANKWKLYKTKTEKAAGAIAERLKDIGI